MIERFYFPIGLLDVDTDDYDSQKGLLRNILHYAISSYCRKHANAMSTEWLGRVFGVVIPESMTCDDYRNMMRGKFKNVDRDRQPFTSINRNILWRYINMLSDGKIDEDEFVTLIFILALDSIMGRNLDATIRTTKGMIFARMNGKPKPSKKDRQRYKDYESRRKFEKLKKMASEASYFDFDEGHHRGVVFHRRKRDKSDRKSPFDENKPF